MFERLKSWFTRKPAPDAAPVAKRKQFDRTALRAAAEKANLPDDLTKREYGPPQLPPGVIPANVVDGERRLAMDSITLVHDERPRLALDDGGSTPTNYAWLNQFPSFGQGLNFPGYPFLAELTQISEYRSPCEVTSTEMTRKWLKHVTKNKGDKADKIAQIDARMKELNVRDLFRRAALLDDEFGRAQIYIDIDEQSDVLSRQLPLELTPANIKKGSIKGLTVIEPYWSTPFSWNSTYPERADFYKPTSWYLMGRKTHASRLLTFVSREVPDILKPAFNFGGISLQQLMIPFVEMWLRTRKSVNDLINNFSTTILATDMQSSLEDGGDNGTSLFERLALFTRTRSNKGVTAINKDTEELGKVDTTLAGLDKLQAQSQEHMATPWHAPLVKAFGVTPTGLNATSEGEIQVWYDWINARQINLFGPQYDTLLKIVQLDLFGAIDDDIYYEWVSLDEPTGKELSEIRASDATAGASYIANGVISPDEERERLQTDPHSGYSNLKGDAPEPEPDPDLELQLAAQSEQADKQRQHEIDNKPEPQPDAQAA